MCRDYLETVTKRYYIYWGPYKSALIAALHRQLRSAAIDPAAKDNAAIKKSLLRRRTKC